MKLCKEINGKKITLTPLNSKTIELTTTGVITEICYSEDFNREITSITIADEYRVTKHGAIVIPFSDRKVTYEINHIIQLDNKKFLLLTHLRNRTTTYLLPSLGLLQLSPQAKELDLKTREEIGHYCYSTYLINAYISAHNQKLMDLVYRFSTHSTYKLLESCLVEHPGYIRTLDKYSQDDYVVFRMEIPLEFQSEVTPFLKGQYSELSEDLKKLILKFHKATKKSRLYHILYKSPELKELLEKELMTILHPNKELDSIPDKSQEFISVL